MAPSQIKSIQIDKTSRQDNNQMNLDQQFF